MDGLVVGIGFFIGIVVAGIVLGFYTIPMVMEEHAEIFCNKDGQGLLEYNSDTWKFKNITCGGLEKNTIIKRNYETQKTEIYDIFIDK